MRDTDLARARAMGRPAGWSERILAFIVDLLIAGTPMATLRLIQVWSGADLGELTPLAYLAVAIVPFGCIRWLDQGRSGRSLGKRLLRLRLVRITDGRPVGPALAFARDLVHLLDAPIVFVYMLVDNLLPGWNPRWQTAADLLTGSQVLPAADPSRLWPQPLRRPRRVATTVRTPAGPTVPGHAPGVGAFIEVAWLRQALAAEVASATQALDAARASGGEVGELPGLARRLRSVAGDLDQELALLAGEPNPGLVAHALPAARARAAELMRIAGTIRRAASQDLQTRRTLDVRQLAADVDREATALDHGAQRLGRITPVS